MLNSKNDFKTSENSEAAGRRKPHVILIEHLVAKLPS